MSRQCNSCSKNIVGRSYGLGVATDLGNSARTLNYAGYDPNGTVCGACRMQLLRIYRNEAPHDETNCSTCHRKIFPSFQPSFRCGNIIQCGQCNPLVSMVNPLPSSPQLNSIHQSVVPVNCASRRIPNSAAPPQIPICSQAQVNTIVSTQRHCCICKNSAQRQLIPSLVVANTWIEHRIYVPFENRSCPWHIMLETMVFDNISLNILRAEIKIEYIAAEEIIKFTNKMFDLLRDASLASITAQLALANQLHQQEATALKFKEQLEAEQLKQQRYIPHLDFDNQNVPLDDYRTLLGLDKYSFNDLLSCIQHDMRSSINRTPRNALAIFLYFLKVGVSQDVISATFNLPQQRVSDIIDTVSEALEANFVPHYLGFTHLRRDVFIARHSTVMSQILMGDPSLEGNLIAILDGTYFYIEKSSNFDFQKRSYSMQKHCNLLKAMIVCMPDGYIIDIEGMYLADGGNNDASIMNSMYRNHEAFTSFLQNQATLIVDRGFRDSVAVAESYGHDVVMPHLLTGHQRQLSDLAANESRCIAKVRWVIESVNGRIKNVFHFFKNNISNHYVQSNKVLRFLRIACAILNKYYDPIRGDREGDRELAQLMVERSQLSNLLQTRIIEENWNSRRVIWLPLRDDIVQDFPRLSLDQLRDFTIGVYQVRLAPSYAASYISLENISSVEQSVPNIVYNSEVPNLLRLKMSSRFRSGLEHYVYIQYTPNNHNIAGIGGWYCTCKTGARVVGCCSHVASLLWYLAYARYQQNLQFPAQYIGTFMRDATNHEESFNGTCTDMITEKQIPCYRWPYGVSASTGNKESCGFCTLQTRGLRCVQTWEERHCSLDAPDFRFYNYFLVSGPGLLYPIMNQYGIVSGCVGYGLSTTRELTKQPCGTHVGLDVSSNHCPDCWKSWDDRPGPFCIPDVNNPCNWFLPNYKVHGPVPKRQGKQDRINMKTIVLEIPSRQDINTDTVSEIRNPENSKQNQADETQDMSCPSGDVVITRPRILISDIIAETSYFTCNMGRLATRVVLLAETEIVIDHDIILAEYNAGIQNKSFTRLIMASKLITVIGNKKIVSVGADGTFAETRPDIAQGCNSGSLYIIGLCWDIKGSLQVTSIAGNSHCTTDIQFHNSPNYNSDNWIKEPEVLSERISYQNPLDIPRTAFDYIGHVLLGKLRSIPIYAAKFQVYNSFARKKLNPGQAGAVKLYGASQILPKVTINYGKSLNCDAISLENVNVQFLIPEYYEVVAQGWEIVNTDGPLGILEYQRLKKQISERPETLIGQEDFNILKKWSHTKKLGWSVDEANKLIDHVTSIWQGNEELMALDTPESLYEELSSVIKNYRSFDKHILVKIVQIIRLKLEKQKDTGEFSKWVYALATAHQNRLQTDARLVVRLNRFIERKLRAITKLYSEHSRHTEIRQFATEYNNFHDENLAEVRDLLEPDVKQAVDQIKQDICNKMEEQAKELEIMLKANVVSNEALETMKKYIFAFAIEQATAAAESYFSYALQGFLPFTKTNNVFTFAEDIEQPQARNNNAEVGENLHLLETDEIVKRGVRIITSWFAQKKTRLIEATTEFIADMPSDDPRVDFLKVYLEAKLVELNKILPKHEEFKLLTEIERGIKKEIENFKYNLTLETTSEDYSVQILPLKFASWGLQKTIEFTGKIPTTGQLMAESAFDALFQTSPSISKDSPYVQQIEIDFLGENSPLLTEINRLAEINEKIYGTLAPLTDPESVDLPINKSSIAKLDVITWKIPNYVKNLRFELQKASTEIGLDLDPSLEKFENTLELIGNIFKGINTLKDQQVLAVFMDEIAEPRTLERSISPEYRNLSDALLQSVIDYEATTVKNAFNQWAFPFASIFSNRFPEDLLENGYYENTTELIGDAINMMTEIKNALEDYENTVQGEVDTFLQTEQFELNEQLGTLPFFTWKHKNHESSITKLLRSETVFFTSYNKHDKIDHPGIKEAIKFNSIGLNIRNTEFSENQDRLNEILRAYKIVMTHLGDSHYTFQEKSYLLSGQPITFTRNYDPKLSSQNFAAVKVSESDPVLSPFANWKLSLQKRDGTPVDPELQSLGIGSDIELIGEGTFLGEIHGERYKDALVDNFYDAIDDASISNPSPCDVNYGRNEDLASITIPEQNELLKQVASTNIYYSTFNISHSEYSSKCQELGMKPAVISADDYDAIEIECRSGLPEFIHNKFWMIYDIVPTRPSLCDSFYAINGDCSTYDAGFEGCSERRFLCEKP